MQITNESLYFTSPSICTHYFQLNIPWTCLFTFILSLNIKLPQFNTISHHTQFTSIFYSYFTSPSHLNIIPDLYSNIIPVFYLCFPSPSHSNTIPVHSTSFHFSTLAFLPLVLYSNIIPVFYLYFPSPNHSSSLFKHYSLAFLPWVTWTPLQISIKPLFLFSTLVFLSPEPLQHYFTKSLEVYQLLPFPPPPSL